VLRRGATGRAVQVDPIKPTLKAPDTKRLELIYDETVSNFAFKFNLRYCTPAAAAREVLSAAIDDAAVGPSANCRFRYIAPCAER
jgi:hypothetical protein